MSACKDMNYCRESEAVCRHNTKKRVKKSFKLFLQMASKIETGLDSHRSRLLPYWHLYMKQTYQYPLVACQILVTDRRPQCPSFTFKAVRASYGLATHLTFIQLLLQLINHSFNHSNSQYLLSRNALPTTALRCFRAQKLQPAACPLAGRG